MKIKLWGVGMAVIYIASVLLLPTNIQADVSGDEPNTILITTQVPNLHTGDLKIQGKGSICIEGKLYTQSQKIKVMRLKEITYKFIPADGYKINKVVYNGQDVTEQLSDNKYMVKPVYEDGISINAMFIKDGSKENETKITYPYKFINGENSEWIQNTKQNLVFIVDGDFEKFRNIEVDGIVVPIIDYNVKKGSTIITLKAAYLNTLTIGKHTLKIEYTDRKYVSTAFTIRAADIRKSVSNPQTGDYNNVLIMILLVLISTGSMIVLTTRKVIQKHK